MKFNNEILIVDDAPENLEYVELVLSEDNYSFTKASSGREALACIEKQAFDLILLDVMMPDMNGFEVCQKIKENDALKDVPVVFLTARLDVDALTHAFQVGGVDYITKPFNAVELLVRVKNHLDLYNAKKALGEANQSLAHKMVVSERRLMAEIEESQKEMIYTLTEMVEASSDETGKHIRRVAEYAKILATAHDELSHEDVLMVYHAAPMHDIGKLTIPSHILHKAGKLTDEEYSVMKTHTIKAHEFFKSSQRRLMRAAYIIATQHHEKWDGTGYPQGLSGNSIHVYGRIVALADVFDALTHKRKYKEAWSIDRTVAYIIECSGNHFDPYIVKLFLQNIDAFISIFNQYSDHIIPVTYDYAEQVC